MQQVHRFVCSVATGVGGATHGLGAGTGRGVGVSAMACQRRGTLPLPPPWPLGVGVPPKFSSLFLWEEFPPDCGCLLQAIGRGLFAVHGGWLVP